MIAVLLMGSVFLMNSAVFGQNRNTGETPEEPSKIRSDVDEALAKDGKTIVFVYYEPTSSFSSASYRQVTEAVQAEISDLAGEAKVRYQYRWVPSVVIEVDDREVLEQIAQIPEVKTVYCDLEGTGALNDSRPFINTDRAYALGVEGAGSVVAVLDTGIEEHHPALESARLYEFEKRFLQAGEDESDNVLDRHGHGTHVAGIVGSRGTPDGQVPTGVATGVRLISVKVLDDQNRGFLSDWVRGLDHVLELAIDEGVRVDAVNMSLQVSTHQFDTECDNSFPSLTRAAQLALDNDIVVCAAAGNAGEMRKLTTPACVSSIISVGSINHRGNDNELSSFSSRAPFLDLVAPGENIVSCALIDGEPELFRSLRGTSQACPHVTGVVALIRHADPTLSAPLIRRMLTENDREVFDIASQRSYPVLDAGRSIEMALSPVFELVQCEVSGGALSLGWHLNERASFIQVHVAKDGVPIHFDTINGDDRRWEFEVPEAGEFEICLRARSLDGSLTGLAECCSFRAALTPRFTRGDCTGDGSVDISDVVNLLWHTFSSPDMPGCEIACDTNSDDEVDISDALYLLNHLFRRGAPPPPPYPGCGTAAPSELGCQVSDCGEDG